MTQKVEVGQRWGHLTYKDIAFTVASVGTGGGGLYVGGTGSGLPERGTFHDVANDVGWVLVAPAMPAPKPTAREPKVGEVYRDPDAGLLMVDSTCDRVTYRWLDGVYKGSVSTVKHSTWSAYFLGGMTYDDTATKAHADAVLVAAYANVSPSVPVGPPLRLTDEAERQVSSALAGDEYTAAGLPAKYVRQPKAHKARCPRCSGPAVELLYSFKCERAGGCRTAEQRIGPTPEAKWNVIGDEGYWECMGSAWPTKDGAIALWRSRALERERVK